MSQITKTGIQPVSALEQPSLIGAKSERQSRWRALSFIWKFFVGALLTQSLVGSIVLFGWLMRASQRVIFKQWFKTSKVSYNEPWESFARQDRSTSQHLHWPNWITAQNSEFWRTVREQHGAKKLRRAGITLSSSIWANFLIGVQGIFNTSVLTLPGCALMAFAWYAGWLNSFNKGYEHAPVGPTMWFAGAFLFCVAMLYVPIAQMRQASTGNWKSFYQFQMVWRLIRKSWFSTMLLALLYTAVSLPFTGLKFAPAFFPQISPALADVTPERALEISQIYFFWCGVLLFLAVLVLRVVAARIYASSLLELIRENAVADYDLGDAEWITLHRLNHLEKKPQTSRHFLVKAAGWIGTRMGRVISTFLLLLVWFSFVVQILVSEFIIKTEPGWLNQPLVQFPAFNYTPSQLKEGKPNI